MKKILATTLAAVAVSASAANFVSVDVEQVNDDKSGAMSHAQYVRAGVDMNGLNLGLQARTQVGTGLGNSLEGTVGTNVGVLNVHGGLGYDNGVNGVNSTQYGVVGVSTGTKFGPVYGYAGVKTRVTWDSETPSQTLAYVGASYPLTKALSVNAGVSKSYQDVKETSYNLGLRLGF